MLQPQEEETRYNIDITITGTKKVGDGMNAYVVYKVCTKVSTSSFVFATFSNYDAHVDGT